MKRSKGILEVLNSLLYSRSNNSKNDVKIEIYINSKMTRHIAIVISRRVPLREQAVLTLLEHMNLLPIFSGVLVTRSLVLCVCCVDCCLSFSPFSFGQSAVYPSIYRLWLPHWYLLTLLHIILISVQTHLNISTNQELCHARSTQ